MRSSGRRRLLLLMPFAVCSLLQKATAGEGAHQVEGPLNPLGAIPKSALRAFVEAPLFEPSRRLPPAPVVLPPPPAPPPPPPAPTPPPSLQLVGVIYGRLPTAFVRENEQAAIRTLHSGDTLDDWVVTIRPGNLLRVTKDGRSLEFRIFSAPGLSNGRVLPPSDADPPGQPETVASHLARRRRLSE